ncbi:MAG TPA: hypothetical protein VHA76_05090 [Solirubrobacterales bacterium]|nr:hypothetical protein [Solirubrobacterales bacterium]
MDRKARREYLQGFLDDLLAQKKVDTDQLLMELLHLVFELDEDLTRLDARLAELERP